jgi:hypothetical protein
MNVRAIGTCIVGAIAVLLSGALNSNAQVHRRTQSSSAAQVAAELTKGKLSPAASKPRDTVVLKLKDDLRSNGALVLRKGTVITGVVRNVKCAEPSGQSQSMIEIVWLAPVHGKGSRSLSIALQSVMQINPIDKPEPEKGDVKTGAVAVAETERANGHPNAALLSMPSVVAVDQQTSAVIEDSLASSSSGPLFRVGRGQLLTAGGSWQSVDIFSHLNNDTLITSVGKDFEISSGAQMHLLVGVNKN